MQWVSTLIESSESIESSIQKVQTEVAQQLGASPDLLLIFASPHFFDHVPAIAEALAAKQFVDCSAGGVVGDQRELEHQPGISIIAARLPEVSVQAAHFEQQDRPDDSGEQRFWNERLRVNADQDPHFILLSDPFTCNPEPILRSLDRCFPRARKIGGLASGAVADSHRLFVNDEVYQSGMIGLAMHGNIEIDTIVAQGCRPIGAPLFITGLAENRLLSLDGKPALRVLEELYQTLDDADQALLRHSLFLGIAMRDARSSYAQGDFLIRNIVGVDKDNGALAIGAHLPPNSVVQFHLRDARTSTQDLEALLGQYVATPAAKLTRGALMFSCLGRGAGLYGAPGHDSGAFTRYIGKVPLGGFFCNGEIGPVHGSTFLHGYTSAFGLFRPKSGAA